MPMTRRHTTAASRGRGGGAGTLSLQTFRRDGATVLVVCGELSGDARKRLGDHAARIVRAKRTSLIIDLSDATFIDSAGMSTLLNARRRATRACVAFAVICPGAALRRPLSIARLESTLNVCDTHAGALRAISAQV